MDTNRDTSKYENAVKHVTELKEFYQQVFVYLIFLILWIVFSHNITDFVVAKTENVDSGFLKWLNINIALVPVFWGVGIGIYALYLFKFKLSIFKKWEDKKIRQLMEEDNRSEL